MHGVQDCEEAESLDPREFAAWFNEVPAQSANHALFACCCNMHAAQSCLHVLQSKHLQLSLCRP